jgi:hypothetical protein
MAEAVASKAEKVAHLAKGIGATRAVGLRSVWRAELADVSAAVRHYWSQDQDEFTALVQRLAERDLRSGKRQIPASP